MGLAANQAKLLAITSRLSDNELRAQFIANSKMRLTDDQNAATAEYMRSLDQHDLMYSYYGADNVKLSEKVTASSLMTYGPNKNQYGIINSAGQILVSSLDIDNFNNSGSLKEFLNCYDILKIDNKKRIPMLESLFGDNWKNFYDPSDKSQQYNQIDGKAQGWFPQIAEYDDENKQWDVEETWSEDLIGKMNKVLQELTDWQNPFSGLSDTGLGGLIGNMGEQLGTGKLIEVKPPDPKPDPYEPQLVAPDPFPVDPPAPRFSATTTVCYGHFMSSGSESCYMATVSYMMQGSDNPAYSSLPHKGGGSIDGTPRDQELLKRGMLEHGNELDPRYDPAQGGVADPAYPNGRTLADSVKKLYDGLVSGEELQYLSDLLYRDADTWYDADDELRRWQEEKDAWDEAEAARVREINEEEFRKYNEAELARELWDREWAKTKNDFQDWMDKYTAIQEHAEVILKNDLEPKIPNPDDPAVIWYTNLWYRMGGESEESKINPNYNFKQLDDNLMKDSAYLQWALETGTVTMEQVVFNENGSEKTPGLKEREWKAIGYNNSSDLKEEQNKLNMTRAEAKYDKTLRELQAQDKQYDMDLKRLDTQHNALQQEYEALKGITAKNIERSFKAFSA
jgi:hypothetical protein